MKRASARGKYVNLVLGFPIELPPGALPVLPRCHATRFHFQLQPQKVPLLQVVDLPFQRPPLQLPPQRPAPELYFVPNREAHHRLTAYRDRQQRQDVVRRPHSHGYCESSRSLRRNSASDNPSTEDSALTLQLHYPWQVPHSCREGACSPCAVHRSNTQRSQHGYMVLL